MRNFEFDFEFDFEEGISCQRTAGFRHDLYKPLVFGLEEDRLNNVDRQAKIRTHAARVKKEKHTKALPLSSLK